MKSRIQDNLGGNAFFMMNRVEVLHIEEILQAFIDFAGMSGGGGENLKKLKLKYDFSLKKFFFLNRAAFRGI
ncbi:MAG: hypothetical protein K8T10_14420 [Candidatus Eremiobacteraeota bacterium]|nr:hypothetical protein [Candidatus Eremiobacteraeota bacterium]